MPRGNCCRVISASLVATAHVRRMRTARTVSLFTDISLVFALPAGRPLVPVLSFGCDVTTESAVRSSTALSVDRAVRVVRYG